MVISASIQALVAGEQVAGSRLSRILLDELMAEGLLLVTTRGSKKSYHARDVEALKRYLIDKDENYRMLDVTVVDSRASLAEETKEVFVLAWRNELKRSSCWPGGTEGQYEDRVVRQEDISMGINPALDYLSMPSSVEIKAGAATEN